jgi:Zn-dependent peptidase ImmA (M78 family)
MTPLPVVLARNILQKHKITECPVPIDFILEKENIQVKYGTLICDGILKKYDFSYVIEINKNMHTYRQRFTIAHELGHFILENDQHENHNSSNENGCATEIFDNQGEERFCDIFASCLLIPDNALYQFFDPEVFSVKNLIKTAHKWRVSITAFLWRLFETSPFEGGAIWFKWMGKPTDSNKLKLRLDRGMFPKTSGLYLPRYDAVSKNSSIYQVTINGNEHVYENIRLNFGNLIGAKRVITKSVGSTVLAIIFYPEVRIKKEEVGKVKLLG